MYLRVLLCTFLLLEKLRQVYPQQQKGGRVAIIGGGIGGTSAAYELTKLAAQSKIDIQIDLYEDGNIGGRLATSNVDGFEFETGGSIIHEENKYMNIYTENFNLGKINLEDTKSNRCKSAMGFYDGNEFVYVESKYHTWSLLKLWWRYGTAIYSIMTAFQQFVDEFKRIYEFQSEGKTFDGPYDFLSDLDSKIVGPELLKITMKHTLVELGFKERIIDEFAFIATNVNYNQNTSIHAFVGSVAMAGTSGPLWAVQGGNKRVPEQLLIHSDAKLLKHHVDSVTLLPDGRYSLEVNQESAVYDYVIVACPVIENAKRKLTFNNFPEPINIAIKYQRTVATLVRGVLNHKYFEYDSASDLPNTIFTVNESLFFNSISVLNPVSPDDTYDCNVFKVFSKDVLTKEQLDLLFLRSSDVKVIDWLAYPLYDTNDRNLTSVLHDNLFYTNAIEWAASAMEMSAIAGHNAALHVVNKLKRYK